MTKKYILKPGRHQFAPGGHAVHSNDNLSDDEALWYIKKYPHIAALFEAITATGKSQVPPINPPDIQETIPEESKAVADDGLTQ